MDYQALKTEIEKPQYAGMNDEQLLTALNEKQLSQGNKSVIELMFGDGAVATQQDINQARYYDEVQRTWQMQTAMETAQTSALNMVGNSRNQIAWGEITEAPSVDAVVAQYEAILRGLYNGG